MFKSIFALIAMALTSYSAIGKIEQYQQNNKPHHEHTLLEKQSLPLSFPTSDFYTWNQNSNPNPIAGIITTATKQAYLLNKDGTYNNLNLQISNFTRFNDDLGIATLNNFHKSDNSNFINKSFLMTKDGVNDNALPLATANNDFVNFTNDSIVSTGIGADLIKDNGKVITLVRPYTYGKGKTSFSPINDKYGIFIGGDQQGYVLKNDGTINKIGSALNPFFAPNPLFLNCFVSINANGGIIRNSVGELFYLTVDSSGKASTISLNIARTSPLISTTTNFFTKTKDNQGIVNINFENSSKDYGQPYFLDTSDSSKFKLTKINDHIMNNFTLFHDNLGVFIDNNETAFFVDDKLIFTAIGTVTNFQRINNKLGIINTNNGKSLLSDIEDTDWMRINTITFTKTNEQEVSNFVNTYIDKGKPTAVDRTNSWISNGPLSLSITNSELFNVTINGDKPLIPNINNNVNTTILNSCTIKINFKNVKTFTYKVLIAKQMTLPTLDNVNNDNYQYVGVVNDNLYDINSTNASAGFTISFNYDSTIQYVNIIMLDINTMIKEKLWTIIPNTTFTLNINQNNSAYLLQTVDWNNNSSWQYFTIYKNNTLPIADFWSTPKGKKLKNFALKFGYNASDLKKMKASEIDALRNKSVNWKIAQNQGNILGYIIIIFLLISFIIAIIAIIYDWYLRRYFK